MMGMAHFIVLIEGNMKKIIPARLLLIVFILGPLFGQWEPDQRLTFSSGNSIATPCNGRSVDVSGDTVHVVWMDNRETANSYEIYYKRSTDGGETWGPDMPLTNSSIPSLKMNPSIVVSDSIVHVVWEEGYWHYNYEIYYKRSTNNGTIWGDVVRLVYAPGSSTWASIAVWGSNVHIVWLDDRYGNPDLYYKCSTDGGETWRPEYRLTYSAVLMGTEYASIAVSGSTIHVVWNDFRLGNDEIYYKRSTDNGITWGPDIRLTYNNPLSSFMPSICASGSNVHIVWWQFKYSLDINYEIYYKRSTDGGETWGQDTRLTNALYTSEFPTVAVSGQKVHVVWDDDRDGGMEIYYKHNPTANPLKSPGFKSQSIRSQ
jgi:hypothetical protein